MILNTKTAANLRIIQTMSAGYDRIDLAKAKHHNVLVASNNGANAVSVAEHVFDANFRTLSAVTVSPPFCNFWSLEKFKTHKQRTCRKNPWYFGLGRIGKALAQRAVALGVKVQYFDVVRQSEAEKRVGPEISLSGRIAFKF